jgi:hypothetical protein
MRRALAYFRRSLALLGVGVVVASGCYKSGAGPDPDDHSPYFPVGVAVSKSGKFLFLANSNFDLRYNSGTLQAFDANTIRERAIFCRDQIVRWRANGAKTGNLGPAPDCRSGVVEANGSANEENKAANFALADVRIGAFAADVTVVDRTDATGTPRTDGGRLLLPVRGDASLTVVDFVEGETAEKKPAITLRCAPGATPNHFGDKCAPGWRLTGGEGGGAGSRGLTLEGEPFAVSTVVGPIGTGFPSAPNGITTVVHQSSGDVSLFVDTTKDDGDGQPSAKLAYTLTGLPGGATSIAHLIVPGDTQMPRFLVANDTQSALSIVQYFPDPKVDRSGLVFGGFVPLTPQSQGNDSRGIVVDPPNPGESRPTRVFVTNRTPAAIVLGQVDDRGILTFYDNVALPVGPSRVTRAVVGGRTMILVASFDARALVVYDPDARRVVDVMLTHRGPYAVAVDEPRVVEYAPDPNQPNVKVKETVQYAYIANFTDSTIQVLDLTPGSTESLIYSVGAPSGPTN